MRRQSIDLLKLIAAYFVIVLHNTSDKVYQLNFQAASRFAVPVFLLISGYFIAESSAEKLKMQIKKVLIYYVRYEAIYILTELILDLLNRNTMRFKSLIIDEVKGFLIGPIIAPHLWYLINLVWVYLIIYIFKKKNRMKMLFYISIICEVVGFLLSNLSVVIWGYKLPLIFTRNFLLYELFFVLLGMLIKKNMLERNKISSKQFLAVSLIFFLIQPLERMLYSRIFSITDADCYLSSFICAVLIFMSALKYSVNSKAISKMAFLSGYIYFMHPFVMRIFSTVLRFLTGRDTEIFKTNIFSLAGYCLFIYAATALMIVMFMKIKAAFLKNDF